MVEGPGTAAATSALAADDRLARAHARLTADGALQFDRTGFQPPEIPGWLRWLGELLNFIAPALKYIFWGGLILIVALLLFAIGRELLKLRAGPGKAASLPSEPQPEWRPDPAMARDLLAQADALAARGLFAEAAHLLLLRSVDDIQKRQPRALGVALTTREIAALKAIPDAARPAFTHIGGLVERSLFGAAPVSATDFADCRKAYEDFALFREARA
ncbi:MAG TPA: hypothetical protein VM348_11910 [Brevundimonas sp.]|nr:hypothetical protein [Brevundimonas sp.]